MTAELRAAIRANPKDREPRVVYADWLTQQGDPRGEWIALHAADGEPAALRRRALWQAHRSEWRAQDIGNIDLGQTGLVTYHDGLVDEISLSVEHLFQCADKLAEQPIRTLRIVELRTGWEAIAKLPVLQTVEELEIGYNLDELTEDALVAVLSAVPRLARLALHQHEDLPVVWRALERCPRLTELEGLDLQYLRMANDRARWLGRAAPKLKKLRLDCVANSGSLLELAGHAAFELSRLHLSDYDGLYGRTPLLADEAIAKLIASPFTAKLQTLSVFGCHVRNETAAALAKLPADLTALDLGSTTSSTCTEGLAACKLPKLTWLSVRHNSLRTRHLEAIRQFGTLETLRVEKNMLDHGAVELIVEHFPKLAVLDICDNPLGNTGALVLAWSDNVTALRSLSLNHTVITEDAIDGIVDGEKLHHLNELNVGENELGRAAVKSLAEAPLDRMWALSVSGTMTSLTAPLFEHAWLPLDNPFYTYDHYERRLQPDGTPVPHKARKKARPQVSPEDARPIDGTSTYKVGESVRDDERGVGIVSAIHPLSMEVKFPRVGTMVYSRRPADAIPFDTKRRFAPKDVILHPKFGAGVVVTATKDRIEVEFAVFGRKTMVHAKT